MTKKPYNSTVEDKVAIIEERNPDSRPSHTALSLTLLGFFFIGVVMAEEVKPKVCAKCGVEKPVDGFYITGCYCKSCRNTISREYYRNNEAKMAKKQREYRRSHPEKMKEIAARDRAKNKKSILAWQAMDRKENPEKYKEKSKEYYRKNKDAMAVKARGYRAKNKVARSLYNEQYYQAHTEENYIKSINRRAAQHQVGQNFTRGMIRFCRTFWGDICPCCGRTLDGRGFLKQHIDHWLPLARGYALNMSNAVGMCSDCNWKKGTRWPAEVFAEDRVVFVERGLVIQSVLWGGAS